VVLVRSTSFDVNVLVIDVSYVVLISIGQVSLFIHACVLWRQTDRKNIYKFQEKCYVDLTLAF